MIKIREILILILVIGGLLGFGLPSPILQGLAQHNLPLKVRQPVLKTDLPAFAENQIIVKFKSNSPQSALEPLNAGHGPTELRATKFGGFHTL